MEERLSHQMEAIAQWTEQFAHRGTRSVFLEVGADEFVKRVRSAYLGVALAAPDPGSVEGVEYHQSMQDISGLRDVAFMRLAPGAELEPLVDLVDANDYPPILFSDEELGPALAEWGYNVHTVRCACAFPLFLAADNLVYSAARAAREPAWVQLLDKSEEALKAGNAEEAARLAYKMLSCCGEAEEHLAHLAAARALGSVDAYERVILSPHSEWELKNAAVKEQGALLKPLKTLAKHTYAPDWVPAGFIGSSASFSNHGLVLRTVNYSIVDGRYVARDAQVRTRNFLCREEGGQLALVGEVPADYAAVEQARVCGMEDVRAFGDGRFLCVCADVNPDLVPQVCYGRLGSASFVPLSMGERRCEKNWLPFMEGSKMRFVYSLQPLVIGELDEDGQTRIVHKAAQPSLDLSLLRGSAPPVPYLGGWLFLVHQVHYAQHREYYHRFVQMSSDYEKLTISKPFFFEQRGVEYSIGMLLEELEDRVRVAYSVADNSTTIAHVSLATLKTLF